MPELKLIQGGRSSHRNLEEKMHEYEKQTILNMVVPGRLYREIRKRRAAQEAELSYYDKMGVVTYLILQGCIYAGAVYIVQEYIK